jgi:hypothetical protein
MNRRFHTTLIVFVAAIICLAAITNNAAACSIDPNVQPPPISERVEDADIVVIGKVIGGGLTERTMSGSSTILVEKYLKGSAENN